MNPEQLPLRDIHLPPPIPWWPPAPGWWALLFIILGAGLLAWGLYRRPRTTPWQHIAERELQIIRHQYESTPDAHTLIRALSALLRRVCLSLYPRQEVAGLTGEAWLAFLDRQAGMESFRHGGGHVLISAPYQAQAHVNVQALLDVCTAWLRTATDRSQTKKHR
jgi:hypothetical protein